MDVYIGFGLLSAAVVVLVFVIFDSWFKSRNPRMAEMTGPNDRSGDDPDFSMHADPNEITHLEIHGSIVNRPISREHPQHTVSEAVVEMRHSPELADLCEGDFPVEHFVEEDSEAPSLHVVNNKDNRVDAEEIQNPQPVAPPSDDSLLILSVMAKPNTRFVSYDLVQAISAAGFQHGDMNIFHYYQQTSAGRVTLFSLASASKPGVFDLNDIGNISSAGLMIFMDIAAVPDPQNAFRTMLETAERMADDLDGELCADPHTAWNEKLVWQYQQKIMKFKTSAKYDSRVQLYDY
jgi:cell division protein ZipA